MEDDCHVKTQLCHSRNSEFQFFFLSKGPFSFWNWTCFLETWRRPQDTVVREAIESLHGPKQGSGGNRVMLTYGWGLSLSGPLGLHRTSSGKGGDAPSPCCYCPYLQLLSLHASLCLSPIFPESQDSEQLMPWVHQALQRALGGRGWKRRVGVLHWLPLAEWTEHARPQDIHLPTPGSGAEHPATQVQLSPGLPTALRRCGSGFAMAQLSAKLMGPRPSQPNG